LCCPSADFRLVACRTRVAFTSVRACVPKPLHAGELEG
jgi:hypothetical protein